MVVLVFWCVCIGVGTNTAYAQTPPSDENGFNLRTFDAAMPSDRFLVVNEGSVPRGLNPKKSGKKIADNYVNGISFFYQHGVNPLRIRDANNERQTIIPSENYLAMLLSFGFGERYGVGLEIAGQSFGEENKSSQNPSEKKQSKLGFADMRLFNRLNLIGKYDSPFALGIQADIWIPTGKRTSFHGDGTFRVATRLNASGIIGKFVYGASSGILFRKHRDFGGQAVGNAFQFASGINYLFGNDHHVDKRGRSYSAVSGFQAGAEVFVNSVLATHDTDPTFLSKKATQAELLFRLAFGIISFDRRGAVSMGFFGGPGLAEGLGTPSARFGFFIQGGGSIRKEPPKPDNDGDGIPNPKDACPDVAGVSSRNPQKNGCPKEPDRDHDGIPDNVDKCPAERGVKAEQGCPAKPKDADNDGVPDKNDACKDQPGVRTSDPKTTGCPDKDGDGIPDKDDACPDEAGQVSKDSKRNGCHSGANIDGKTIKIDHMIQFGSGGAVILEESNSVLKDIAEVLKSHPEIDAVLIIGHSDNVGQPAANKALSKRRAESVLTWLVKNGGIAAERMKAIGMGDAKPIASNTTKEGQAANRRVEIRIVKKDDPEFKLFEKVRTHYQLPLENQAPRAVWFWG
jgi:OmpA-OmpF porin, OOP family